MPIGTNEIPTTSSVQRQRRIISFEISGIDIPAPPALLEHLLRERLPPIKPKHRLFQTMPLDDAHRLWDTTRTAPAVLGDRGHFL